ncbi:MAG: hypothetical protein P9M13_01215 [Candidatus Ancaeobacter aquaticus]|nr:hypothetical protein [Candidatus Ancaeobacter aquaticus]
MSQLIEYCPKINVYQMLKEGKFAKEDALNQFNRLSITSNITPLGSDDKISITTSLYFTGINTQFGGVRLYFQCPSCMKMVNDLYSPGLEKYACRHCHKLFYSMQRRHRESSWELLHKNIHKLNKLERKAANKYLRKPTKEKMNNEFDRLNDKSTEGLYMLFGKYANRFKRRDNK